MNPRIMIVSTALVLALWPAAALPQSGGAYEITRSTHSGGGLIPLAGGEYVLGGSLGQADAGALAGAGFSLIGGFWGGAAVVTTGAGPTSDLIPKVFSSRLASANPFTRSLTLAFALPSAQRVSLAIYGVDGRVVRKLPGFERQAGRHQVTWDGSDEAGQRVAPGIYFVKLQAGRFTATHRVVHLD